MGDTQYLKYQCHWLNWFLRAFVIKTDISTHETQKKKGAFYLSSLRQKLGISSCKAFFLVACFGHLHLDFWLVQHFKNLCLTRTLHHPVLPETGVSAPMGWLSATLQSCRKTKASFTTGMWQSIFPGSEWLAGHNIRLLFSHMCFICAVYTNTVAFKSFLISLAHMVTETN